MKTKRSFKRIISVLLTVLMIMSALATGVTSVSAAASFYVVGSAVDVNMDTVTGTMATGKTVYVESDEELSAITMTTTLEGAAAETAVKMSKAGDVNGKYYYSCTLQSNADSFTFTATVKGETASADYTKAYSANKNMFTLSTSLWTNYEIDKENAYSDGLWIDIAPDVKNSSITLLKWSNQYGSSGSLGTNTYNLYIPSGNTDDGKKTVPVYSKYSSLTIENTTSGNTSAAVSLNQGDAYTFENKNTYKVTGDNTEYTMTVYISKAAAMLLGTSDDMPTKPGTAKSNAVWKNGAFMTLDETGAVKDKLQTLTQIKGRGNSSWNASQQVLGKYAYNIKLNSKIDPLNMGATKAKSFCLLANNMDESLLRNMVTYQMAEDAGLPFVPNFKVVDVFDNGTYLGSYLLTEKVDVGGSKLVHGETVEDYHSGYNADDTGFLSSETTEYFYINGSTTPTSITYRYANTGVIAEGVNYKEKSYLLEFDLKTRAQAEHCWFVTPQGKYIAVKAPEDLNQEEMRYIIKKWCEVEDYVYKNDYDKASELMDMQSFAETYLVQEFTKNLDAAETSYYVYFDGTQGENTKWKATPLWDYDWALGQYGNGSVKTIKITNDSTNNLTSDEKWFAKYKILTIDENDLIKKDVLNFQAQLANIDKFWNNDVKYVWNHGLKDAAENVFSTKIDNFYNTNVTSFDMNEARWGFVKDDPLNWGSADTGDTMYDAKDYLQNYGKNRTTWMNDTGLLSATVTTIYADPADFDDPDILFAFINGTSTKMEKITTEEDPHYGYFAAKNVGSDSFTFAVSKDGTNAIGGAQTITPGSDYHVNADGTVANATDECNKGHKPAVSISLSKNIVSVGSEITVTAKAVRALGSCEITYQHENDTKATTLKNSTFIPEKAGTYTFTASASNYFGSSKANVQLTVQGDTPVEPVITGLNIFFKGTNLSYLTPSLQITAADGTLVFKEKEMLRGKNIGYHPYGTYAIEWYTLTTPDDVKFTAGNNYTFTFTANGKTSTVVSDLSQYATGSDIYFAVDNLQTGGTAYDITDNETAKSVCRCSVHMITNVDASAGVANISVYTANAYGVETKTTYILGDVNRDYKLNIRDAASIQLRIAKLEASEETDSILGDFNIDGELNIKDSAALQLSLAKLY